MKPITALRDLYARKGTPGKFGWPYDEKQTRRMVARGQLGPVFRLHGARLDLIHDDDLAASIETNAIPTPKQAA